MGLLHSHLLSGIILNMMINEPNYLDDIHADDLFIEADERNSIPMIGADEHDVPVWIENEDGSGQWSDGWDGSEQWSDDHGYNDFHDDPAEDWDMIPRDTEGF